MALGKFEFEEVAARHVLYSSFNSRASFFFSFSVISTVGRLLLGDWRSKDITIGQLNIFGLTVIHHPCLT